METRCVFPVSAVAARFLAAIRMALDVDQTLHAVVTAQGSMTADAARDYVKQMTKSTRYQRDVY